MVGELVMVVVGRGAGAVGVGVVPWFLLVVAAGLLPPGGLILVVYILDLRDCWICLVNHLSPLINVDNNGSPKTETQPLPNDDE